MMFFLALFLVVLPPLCSSHSSRFPVTDAGKTYHNLSEVLASTCCEIRFQAVLEGLSEGPITCDLSGGTDVWLDVLLCNYDPPSASTVLAKYGFPLWTNSAELREKCDFIREKGLRSFCSGPHLEPMRGCSLCNNSAGLRPCDNALATFGVPCDNLFHCPDRSDESGCAQETVEVSKTEFVVDPVSGAPIPLPPPINLYEQCTSSGNIGGVRVGEECMLPQQLCRKEVLYNTHLQELNVCRNRTFWSNKGEDRCGERVPCDNGNYPGFCVEKEVATRCRSTIGFSSTEDCHDYSNVKFCADTVDCEKHHLFRCHDNKTCIARWLVCDGHTQCKDGSDEQQDCGNCDRRQYYPQIGDQPWTATHMCHHRDTGRPICATPCDSIDDLCAGNEDENCRGLPVAVTFLLVSGMPIVIGCLARCFHKPRQSKKKQNKAETVELKAQNNPTDEGFEGDELVQLIAKVKAVEGVEAAANMCKDIYRRASSEHGDNIGITDLYFLKTLGTNEQAKFFFEAVDDSLVFRLQLRLQQIFWTPPGALLSHAKFAVLTVLYYADFLKDVYLIVHFKGKMLPADRGLVDSNTDSFLLAVFYAIVASVCVAEVANVITWVTSAIFKKSMATAKKVMSLLLTPLLPGLTQYWEDVLLKAAEQKHYREKSHDYESWMQIKRLGGQLRRLRTQFRSNENVAEHFVQLTLLLILICVDRSDSRTVENLSKVLLGDVNTFLLISAVLSVLSLVSGHVFYLDGHLNGHLSVKGKAILFAYYLASCVGRVVAVLLFLTPSLGLFNTSFQAVIGVMGGRAYRVYDLDTNGKYVSLEEAWSRFRLESKTDLFRHPAAIAVMWSVLALLIVIRLAAVYLVRTRILGKSGLLRSKDVYSLICPPLFYDWLNLFNKHGERAISEHWSRSAKAFLAFVGLFVFEHLCLSCVPLAMLKHVTDRRAAEMSDFFPLLPEEKQSEHMIKMLLGCGAVGYGLVLPAVQILLAAAYFRYGHPWSRVLRRQAKILPWR